MELEIWLYFFLLIRNALDQHADDIIDAERK